MYTHQLYQSTISTRSREFPTLLHVGYHTITDHIQFDMMECVTMQLWIMFNVTVQSCTPITFECATMQLHIAFKHLTEQLWITFI